MELLHRVGGLAHVAICVGYLCVCCVVAWNYAVIKLDSNGNQVALLASPAADGTAKISAAAGLAIDTSNQVYVLDSLSNNRILKFPAMLNKNGAVAATASIATLLATIVAVLVASL